MILCIIFLETEKSMSGEVTAFDIWSAYNFFLIFGIQKKQDLIRWCSSLLSIYVIKNYDPKQLGKRGFISVSTSGHSPPFREVKQESWGALLAACSSCTCSLVLQCPGPPTCGWHCHSGPGSFLLSLKGNTHTSASEASFSCDSFLWLCRVNRTMYLQITHTNFCRPNSSSQVAPLWPFQPALRWCLAFFPDDQQNGSSLLHVISKSRFDW